MGDVEFERLGQVGTQAGGGLRSKGKMREREFGGWWELFGLFSNTVAVL